MILLNIKNKNEITNINMASITIKIEKDDIKKMNYKYSINDTIIFDNNHYKILNCTRQGGINYYLIPYMGYYFVEEYKLTSLKKIRKDKINEISSKINNL